MNHRQKRKVIGGSPISTGIILLSAVPLTVVHSFSTRARDAYPSTIGLVDPLPLTWGGDKHAVVDLLHPEISNLDPLAHTRRKYEGFTYQLPLLSERAITMKKRGGGTGSTSHLSAATLTAEIPYYYNYEALVPAIFGATGIDPSYDLQHVASADSDDWGGTMKSVVSTAFLITGSTVGPSMMCLPKFAAGPGMGLSAALFMGLFGINLLSGLIIAELAIEQHERSEDGDIPSSFKDFADATLQNPMAGNAIASMSVFINWCVLAFSLVRGGEMVSTYLLAGTEGGLIAGQGTATACLAATVATLVATQTTERLSGFASVAVAVLFASFAGMMLPGLAGVSDPMGTLLAPGTATAGEALGSAAIAAPIFIQCMIYQNIVPSVTKILGFDRTKCAAAIFLGSLIPIIMFMAFCFAVLGGGLDNSMSGGGSPFFAAFSVASIFGSTVAGIMSIAEEFDSVLSNWFQSLPSSVAEVAAPSLTPEEKGSNTIQPQTVSVPSVVLATVPPLLAGMAFSGGEEFSTALSCSGQLCPLLYGVLPVLLTFVQCENNSSSNEKEEEEGALLMVSEQMKEEREDSLIPGGPIGLSLVGVSSLGFVGQEILSDISLAIASSGMAI